jgi:hypothetical protein
MIQNTTSIERLSRLFSVLKFQTAVGPKKALIRKLKYNFDPVNSIKHSVSGTITLSHLAAKK